MHSLIITALLITAVCFSGDCCKGSGKRNAENAANDTSLKKEMDMNPVEENDQDEEDEEDNELEKLNPVSVFKP